MLISICADCVVMDANGWDEQLIGRPIPTPTPLGLVPPGSALSSAIGYGERFTWTYCQGCGSTLGGARWEYIIREAKI